MALATASNWLWNFLMSFFTRFITGDIGYLYGLVFAGCCAALVFIVFFFVIESKDRSLEEINKMYELGIVPWKSRHPSLKEINDMYEVRNEDSAKMDSE
jgi:SP family sugar:H+ symporter-like MFS transporter